MHAVGARWVFVELETGPHDTPGQNLLMVALKTVRTKVEWDLGLGVIISMTMFQEETGAFLVLWDVMIQMNCF